MLKVFRTKLVLGAIAASAFSVNAVATDYDQLNKNAISLLSQFIRANSENPPGNETAVVNIAKARLDQACTELKATTPNADCITYDILEFEPAKPENNHQARHNIVLRLKGNGKQKPILIIPHSDVVPTANQAWTTDPHDPVEKAGYIHGRGSMDILSYGANLIELMIEIKKSGATLERDIIFAFVGDEERGGKGIQHLLKNHRNLIDAEFALNEGGSLLYDANTNPVAFNVSGAEKVYMDYRISTLLGKSKKVALHPAAQNGFLLTAVIVEEIAKIQFPTEVSDLVKEYLGQMAKTKTKPEEQALKAAMLDLATNGEKASQDSINLVSADVGFNSVIRTTCVPTLFNTGLASPVAQKSSAVVNVNCRILPREERKEGEVADTLKKKNIDVAVKAAKARFNKLKLASGKQDDTFVDYKLMVHKAPGGPSWRPQPKNALVFLSKAITTLAWANFPKTGVSCVPTTLLAGTAVNVLAATAMANINCRIPAGETAETVLPEVLKVLQANKDLPPVKEPKDVKDPEELRVTVEINTANPTDPKDLVESPDKTKLATNSELDRIFGQASPPSPTNSPVFTAIRDIAATTYNGLLVIPSLLTGASDSRWTRRAGIPTYGVGASFIETADLSGIHNANERVKIVGVHMGAQFYHQLLLKLTNASGGRTPSSIKKVKKASDESIYKVMKQFHEAHAGECVH